LRFFLDNYSRNIQFGQVYQTARKWKTGDRIWQTADRSFGIGKRHCRVLFCGYDVENLINRTHAFFPKKPGFLPNLWATTKDFAKKPGF
jgi:hypothetical protein